MTFWRVIGFPFRLAVTLAVGLPVLILMASLCGGDAQHIGWALWRFAIRGLDDFEREE